MESLFHFQDPVHRRRRPRPLFRPRHETRPLPQDPTSHTLLRPRQHHHLRRSNPSRRHPLDARQRLRHLLRRPSQRLRLPQRPYRLLHIRNLRRYRPRSLLLAWEDLLWAPALLLDRCCNARHHVGYLEDVAQKGGLGVLDQLAVNFRGHVQCAASDGH
jgi:hypothetical protein